MVKKIAAVAGGVLIGLVIAFARAGAFPFWGFRLRRFQGVTTCAAATAAGTGKPGCAPAGASGSRRSCSSAAAARGTEYT